MLIVGDNLNGIVRSLEVCDQTLVEEFSLGIRLDGQVRRMRKTPNKNIIYGTPYDPDDMFQPVQIIHDAIDLAPGDRLLACSQHDYAMPVNYFGLIQTKGSLARLFVSATCNDGQVEPGYKGRITLEIWNGSSFSVTLPVGSAVAQIFVFRCSTEAKPYAGRYQNATGPTVADFVTRL